MKVILPLFFLSVQSSAALVLTYKSIPSSAHHLVDFMYVGASFYRLNESAFTEGMVTVNPTWQRATYDFDRNQGFLEVPLIDGPVTQTIRILSGGSEPYREMARVRVISIASPLKISGPFHFLQEMVRAGQAGRDLRCSIGQSILRIEVNGGAGGEYRGYTQETTLFGADSPSVGHPSRCQISIQ